MRSYYPGYLRLLCGLTFVALQTGCVSYEPARLVPALTLSAEDISLTSVSADGRLDFGVETTVNESDSLFNVEILPGVRVREVAAGGPAAAAGIQTGDIILAVDGMETDQPDAIEALRLGDEASAKAFTVQRGTTVFLAMLTPRISGTNPPPIELYRIDPIASRAGYETQLLQIDERGPLAAARVREIFPLSPLPDAGIEVGDLILAVDDVYLSSAQDLVTRLNRDYELGARVTLTVYDGAAVRDTPLRLWDPGRRLSRLSLGPLLRYESSLNPPARSFTLLDLWLLSLYRYQQRDGERSHSILGLINISSDFGELTEVE